MAQDARKSELIAELARSREALTNSLRSVQRGVDVPQRVAASIARNNVAWITGASALGFLLAKLPARTRKVVVDHKGRPAKSTSTAVTAGLLVTGLKLAFDLARPALTQWVTRRVAEYAQQRFTPPDRH